MRRRTCKHKSLIYVAFSIVTFAFPSLTVSPTIAAISSNQTVNETGNVTLSCQAKGIPPPTITWLKADDERKNLSSSSELSSRISTGLRMVCTCALQTTEPAKPSLRSLWRCTVSIGYLFVENVVQMKKLILYVARCFSFRRHWIAFSKQAP